jgi:hypothetical protein
LAVIPWAARSSTPRGALRGSCAKASLNENVLQLAPWVNFSNDSMRSVGSTAWWGGVLSGVDGVASALLQLTGYNGGEQLAPRSVGSG